MTCTKLESIILNAVNKTGQFKNCFLFLMHNKSFKHRYNPKGWPKSVSSDEVRQELWFCGVPRINSVLLVLQNACVTSLYLIEPEPMSKLSPDQVKINKLLFRETRGGIREGM